MLYTKGAIMQKCGFALFALVVVINTFMSLPKMGYSMMLLIFVVVQGVGIVLAFRERRQNKEL